MKSEYRTLFDARGAHYNFANRRYPDARAEEAQAILADLDLRRESRWLDVGAGGGFLAERAAAEGIGGPVHGCDESIAFLSGASAYALRAICAFGRLPYPDGTFAGAASLAALHHAEEPETVLAEMLRVTAPGGRIAIGDVAAQSRAARFLNGFLDRCTANGHAGRFYSEDAWVQMLRRAGGCAPRAQTLELSWHFRRREDAADFCRELFGLLPGTPTPELQSALDDLGLMKAPDGWRLRWDMVFASAGRV